MNRYKQGFLSFSEADPEMINFFSDAFGHTEMAEATMESMSGWILRGVEIFKAGTYRGQEYTADDLEEMADNFQTLKKAGIFEPVFKKNHSENVDDQIGWIADVYAEGDLLMADLHLTEWLAYDKIESKTWKYVSAEIYPPSLSEEEFPDSDVRGYVLRGVAVVSVPKVKGLKGIVLNSEILDQKEEGNIVREKLIAMLSKRGINFSEEELKSLKDEDLEAKLMDQFSELDTTIKQYKEKIPKQKDPKQKDKDPKQKDKDPKGGSIVEQFGEGAVVMTADDFMKVSKNINELEGKVETFSEDMENMKKASKKKHINGSVDKLIKEGRIVPSEKDEIVQFAESLPEESADKYLEQLKKRPQVVEFGEIGAGQEKDEDDYSAEMDQLDKMKTYE